MKHKLLHLQSLVAVALCVIMAMAFTSCSDDEPDSDPEIPEIWVDQTEFEFDYKDDLTREIPIHGDPFGYFVYTEDEWLAGSHRNYDKIVIEARMNLDVVPRIGQLRVANPNGGNTIWITVEQAGKPQNEGGGVTSKLATPTIVSVANIGTASKPTIRIAWKIVPNATRYEVIRDYQAGGYQGTSFVASEVGDTREEYIVDYDVVPNSVYYYQVKAYADGYKESDWSSIKSIELK